jgi:hypothetical protein
VFHTRLRRTKGLFLFRFVTGVNKGQHGGSADCGTGNLKTWSKQSDIGRNSKFKDLGLLRHYVG